ncbi:hypothetical protein [Gimesia maris]|uniref:hypothetical protein n=1 Tax=Gimesia maris TaxID=122 RepID=UPI0032F07E96
MSQTTGNRQRNRTTRCPITNLPRRTDGPLAPARHAPNQFHPVMGTDEILELDLSTTKQHEQTRK